MDSMQRKINRYNSGGITSLKSNGDMRTWERTVIPTHSSDVAIIVAKKYVGRIDRLAHDFYGDHRYAWLICQFNNIINPFTEVYEGRTLILMAKERAEAFASNRNKGVFE